MMNRVTPDGSPKLALTDLEIELLDHFVKDKDRTAPRAKTLSHHLTKIARLGGYLNRARDPAPGNVVMCRGLSRLTDLELGAIGGAASQVDVLPTGREAERTTAENSAEALGGLPLAPEQAAAYCERLDISFIDYRKRFEIASEKYLGDARWVYSRMRTRGSRYSIADRAAGTGIRDVYSEAGSP
jgi:hypothetical protein